MVRNRKAEIDTAIRNFLDALGFETTDMVLNYLETHPEFPRTMAHIVASMVIIGTGKEDDSVSALVNKAGKNAHPLPFH